MAHTGDSLKQKFNVRILLYYGLSWLGILLSVASFAGSGWLGYTAWSHLHMLTPPQPDMIPIYVAGSAGLAAISIVLLLTLLFWNMMVKSTIRDRDFAHLFLYFAQEYLSNVTPAAQRCNSNAELYEACKEAGIKYTNLSAKDVAEVEDIILALKDSDIDQQFKDLEGFAATHQRQLTRYSQDLEQARVLRDQRAEIVEKLRNTQAQTKSLEQEAAAIISESNVTSIR